MRAVAVIGLLGALLAVAAPAPATPAPTTAALTGTEIVPVSSRRGTFVGVSTGSLLSGWRVQVVHEPLAIGSTVAVTGGSFTLVTTHGDRLQGPVTGGSVSVLDRGSGCRNQVYRVRLDLAAGRFDGTLTHRRRSLLGRCVLYAATIKGSGTFAL